jgi:hypothetical protein
MVTPTLALRRQYLAGLVRRLLTEQRALALQIGRLLQQAAARSGEGALVVPNQQGTREALKTAIWSTVLRPYYWGATVTPLAGPAPQSPYAQLLVAGIVGAVGIEVAHQVVIIQRVASADVRDWLLTATPSRRPWVPLLRPTFAEWTDPQGFRLVDRVVRLGIDARVRVNRFLDYHVSQATPLPALTDRLEAFLTTGERQRTAYGQHGSYAARRLLASEMKVAAGYAAINASAENPAVKGLKWQLNRLYDETDQCDRNSVGGPDGDGVYPAVEVPSYPDHPNEQCDILPVPADKVTDALRQLQADIAGRTEAGMRAAGRFSPEALQAELLGMERQPALSRLSPRTWVRQADGTLTWRFVDPHQVDPSPPTALLRQRQAERAAAQSRRNE